MINALFALWGSFLATFCPAQSHGARGLRGKRVKGDILLSVKECNYF